MMHDQGKQRLLKAVEQEEEKFRQQYAWLLEEMPDTFFNELCDEHILLIAHDLMGLHLQDYFSQLRQKNIAFVLSLDSANADIRALGAFRNYGIKNYRTYVSKSPFHNGKALRVAAIFFTEAVETGEEKVPPETFKELRTKVREFSPDLSDQDFATLVRDMNTRFVRSLTIDRLAIAIHMYDRAKTRDHCQYEVSYNDEWQENGEPSMQVILAWSNTPKSSLLYRLAQLVHRHNLVMQRVNITYINPYSGENILLMVLRLHGDERQAAWDAADIPDFLRELMTLKYFGSFGTIFPIEKVFVENRLVRGNLGNLLKCMVYFIHQTLVNLDAALYDLDGVEEALCRHPELTLKLCEAFEHKFHPDRHDLAATEATCNDLLKLIKELDTGQPTNDIRRKNVLLQGINFVQHVLKTNFYRNNKTSLSFRLDPHYLEMLPYPRADKYPELPYAIFFIKGMHFIGFHVRFRDLSRGGLRTVYPAQREVMIVELNNVFNECYGLAYTQQKKNKDIPEGGSKGVIFLKPYDRLEAEAKILRRELRDSDKSDEEIESQVALYVAKQKQEYVRATQRSYVDSLLTLINCEDDGQLKAKHIVDYYQKPEYIYLGPDEGMTPDVIQWIASHSSWHGYKPGISFISSKPLVGINHKEYGVTSLGVNVYMHEVLLHLGIDPCSDPFTIKISGGPDGDVAGNQILNLYKYYPKTAKLLALTDVSGTINDPEGLDLEALVGLFHRGKPIADYPPEKLSDGGFLLDRRTTRDATAYTHQTLCWRKWEGRVTKDWLSGNETAKLFANNVHQTPVDLFIPAGGRPRTLNATNYHHFLDETGKPTARAIVEGANLYLTPEAREALQDLGVLIIKDSSANKCGVICSSFEVLCGLVLNEAELVDYKATYIPEVLDILRNRALDEARVLLTTYSETGGHVTVISDAVSERINTYTDQLLAHLVTVDLPKDTTDPRIRCFLNYCPPFLRDNYEDRLLTLVPEIHKKAIIASSIASKLVYTRGLNWHPSIIDILPILWQDSTLLGS